jgi:exoribonuclease R
MQNEILLNTCKIHARSSRSRILGVISGVTEWGIYVEIIENKCEGMCRIRDIKDDYYF